jgi:hypothetical protein
VLSNWSKQIKAKERIKLTNSAVFILKRIVVVVNPVQNKYKMMLKIMAEAQENIFALSQLLFCRKETTRNEVFAFVKRSLLDPFKRIYFIMNIHVLEYYLLLELRSFINKIIETEGENVNYNLLIFADKTEYHKDLLENENFCADMTLDTLDQTVTDEDIRKKYAHIFSANQLVVSSVAGMGKSTYVAEKCREFDLVDLFLSGELNKVTVTKRLKNLSRQSKDKQKLAINVKLDFIEDFNIVSDMVDYTLFSLSLVNRYYTDMGCKDLRNNLRLVFFEIGNTYSTELLMELDTLKIFNVEAREDDHRVHKFKVSIPDFHIMETNFNEDLESNEQIVANFFDLYDNSLFAHTRLQDSKKIIEKDRFHQLLKKYFMMGKSDDEKKKVTYAQYQFWLKTLALMIKEFDKVEDLAPAQLEAKEMSKDVRVEIAEEINMFASQIINMSVSQAKESQNFMKDLLGKLSKDDIKSKKMDEYKNKFVNLEPWDSRDMLTPLFKDGRMLIAHTNLELFNKKDSLRYRKRINLKAFIRSVKTFVDHEKQYNSSELYLGLLAKLLGQDLEVLKKRTSEFKGGKGFCITTENFMKICLII